MKVNENTNKELIKLAKIFASREFELSKVKLPSIHDYKGRDAYRSFAIELKKATEKVDSNRALYSECVETFGELFVEQVNVERRGIGKKYFGFN